MKALRKQIKVLIVEDSPTVREFLTQLLSSDPELLVVGSARDGEQALTAVERLRPDLVTMDIHMPNMDGFEATRRIMESRPLPIVIVTGSADPKEVATSFLAMEAGALAVLNRPYSIDHAEHNRSVQELIGTIKAMAEVKVVRRWSRDRFNSTRPLAAPRLKASGEIELVAIGASTGGPPVLQAILSGLPRDFPAAVVVVQHIATGFVGGFVEWLAQSSAVPVRLAEDGERLEPARAYVAPDGAHLTVSATGRVVLASDPPVNGLRPSVSRLFRSVAGAFGPRAIGVLLTGMGRDGAEELKLMRDAGAFTIAQDEASSIVYGMPREAVQLDAAVEVLAPQEIAAALSDLTRRNERDAK